MNTARIFSWACAGAMTVTLAAGAYAQSTPQSTQRSADRAAPSTVEKSRDGIEYVSGGVGVDAQDRINERARDFNLKLVFTLNEGNYLADVGVALKDAKGRTVVEDTAEGPFFLAKLPAGQYTVAATYDGKTVTRKVQVGKGLRTEYLRWPSNPENDSPLPREQVSTR